MKTEANGPASVFREAATAGSLEVVRESDIVVAVRLLRQEERFFTSSLSAVTDEEWIMGMTPMAAEARTVTSIPRMKLRPSIHQLGRKRMRMGLRRDADFQ